MSQNRFRKTMTVITVILLLIVLIVSIRIYSTSGKRSWPPFVCNSTVPITQKAWSGTNTLVVYTGRWKFLRILLPYVYRELRKSGGVLDRVWFIMMEYDSQTLEHLTEFIKVANGVLREEVFEMRFLPGYSPGHIPPENARYAPVYYDILAAIIQNSTNRFFKMDDDIVYIHPGTFRKMIESKNSACCNLHFGNIVSNWRSNYLHQNMGIYDDEILNPKRLKFEFSPSAYCGWKSPECAELTLRTFLHNYHQKQLDKYLFNGIELLVKRRRYSINLFMMDKDVIDIRAMQDVGPIFSSDEKWWTVDYSSYFRQPNCIVGGGFVVHFSYRKTYQAILKTGLISEFEIIVQKEVGTQMEKKLWKALQYSVDAERQDEGRSKKGEKKLRKVRQ